MVAFINFVLDIRSLVLYPLTLSLFVCVCVLPEKGHVIPSIYYYYYQKLQIFLVMLFNQFITHSLVLQRVEPLEQFPFFLFSSFPCISFVLIFTLLSPSPLSYRAVQSQRSLFTSVSFSPAHFPRSMAPQIQNKAHPCLVVYVTRFSIVTHILATNTTTTTDVLPTLPHTSTHSGRVRQ